MKVFPVGLLIIGLFCAGVALGAAEEPVKATGDSIWGDTNKKMTYMEGHVRIVQGSTVVTTQKAEIDLDHKRVLLKNQVKMVNTEVTIESDNLSYDFRKKTGTFTDNVVMNRTESKNGQGKVTKEPFRLTAAELFLDTNTKNFNAKTGVSFHHQDFEGTADQAEYNDKLQELVFKGNAFLKRPEGEEIRGDWVKINLQDRSFVVKDNVTVNFKVEEEPDNEPVKQK
jgi:lipopolysaccharide transport protein LptA